MLKWIISVLSAAILFGNTTVHHPVRNCRIITEITVEWESDRGPATLRITDQPEMSKLLHYLRHLDPQPETNTGKEEDALFRISLNRSDGRVFRIHQRGISHIQQENGAWKAIDPEEGIRLPLILAVLSDRIIYN